MRKKITVALLGVTLLLPMSSIAEQPAARAVTMEEIVVTAARSAEPLQEVTSSIMVIDAKEIADSGSHDLGELLARKGIGHIQRYPGGLTAIGIRGFRTDALGNDLRGHVLVLLNGRRAGSGNLTKFDCRNIERLEIIRGPGAVQYGSAAMGGVINIITRQGRETPKMEIFGTLGSFGYEESGILFSGARSGLDFSSSFSRSSSDDYDTGSAKKFSNTGNDHKDHYSVNVGFTFMENHRLGLIYSRYDAAELGNPGYLTANDLDNYKNSSNDSFDFSYGGKTTDNSYKWFVRYFNGQDKGSWHDPVASNANGWDDGIPSSIKKDQQGGQVQISFDRDIYRITTGGEWVEYDTDTTWDPEKTEYKNYAGFVLAKAGFLERKLIVDAGLRYDQYKVEVVKPAGRDENDNNITPSIGIIYQISNNIRIRAHYGEAFVMPGADQMGADYYSPWGTHYLGNPDLDPEKSKTWEAGINYEGSQFFAQISYFYSDFDDKIESKSVGFSQSWENVGNADISGIEGDLSLDIAEFFNWKYTVTPYINFVYLDRYRDNEKHEDLKYINEWNASYGIKIEDNDSFHARLNFVYTGKQNIDDWLTGGYPTPVKKMDGFTVADLTIGSEIMKFDFGSLSLEGEVANLFDKNYAYVNGYPMPGRSFIMTLTYNY